jgi:hypothetical protein
MGRAVSPYSYADSYPGRCRISCFAGNPALAWAGIASRLRRLVVWRNQPLIWTTVISIVTTVISIVRLALMGRKSWVRERPRAKSLSGTTLTLLAEQKPVVPTGLGLPSWLNPGLASWAIFFRPCGTGSVSLVSALRASGMFRPSGSLGCPGPDVVSDVAFAGR